MPHAVELLKARRSPNIPDLVEPGPGEAELETLLTVAARETTTTMSGELAKRARSFSIWSAVASGCSLRRHASRDCASSPRRAFGSTSMRHGTSLP